MHSAHNPEPAVPPRASVLDADPDRLKGVWNQKCIPVVVRTGRKGEKLRVRIPFVKDNRSWLQNEQRLSPEWNKEKKHWEIPKAWFNAFVDRALARYGAVYVIQPYREQEICASACWNALGHECQCSCMGANHGSKSVGGWFEVSETFATRWGEQVLACRLMVKRKD